MGRLGHYDWLSLAHVLSVGLSVVLRWSISAPNLSGRYKTVPVAHLEPHSRSE